MSAQREDAVPELDPVIHAAARLRLVAGLAALVQGDRIAFPRLQALQGLTAGNLGAHLRKLEDAGYVDVEKTHRGRTPTTYVSLTRRGRQALEDHTAALRHLLEPVTKQAVPAGPSTSGPSPTDRSPTTRPGNGSTRGRT